MTQQQTNAAAATTLAARPWHDGRMTAFDYETLARDTLDRAQYPVAPPAPVEGDGRDARAVKRTRTERGFVVYGDPIDDGRGGEVTVHRSSAVEPHVWLTVTAEAILTGPVREVIYTDHGMAPAKAMAHLDEEAATRARDALDAWLRDTAAARAAADEYVAELARELGIPAPPPAAAPVETTEEEVRDGDR